MLEGMDVTRWREDHTRDCWGQYCYVRNLDDGRVWSACRQPIGRNADEYESDLRSDRAIIRRRDCDVETSYEIAVVPDADAEVRRITLTNRGEKATHAGGYKLRRLLSIRAPPTRRIPLLPSSFWRPNIRGTARLVLPPPAARSRSAACLGSPGPGERGTRKGRVRDRSCALSWAVALYRGPCRDGPWRRTFGDNRSGPGPGVQPSPADPGGTGNGRRAGVHHGRCEGPGSGSGTGRPLRQPGERGRRL